jgi:hypothetical protein
MGLSVYVASTAKDYSEESEESFGCWFLNLWGTNYSGSELYRYSELDDVEVAGQSHIAARKALKSHWEMGAALELELG